MQEIEAEVGKCEARYEVWKKAKIFFEKILIKALS